MTRREQALATRAKICSASIALFSHTPYEQVKVADICTAAGVSVGAFYHYFGSKEDLLNEGYSIFDHNLQASWKGNEQMDPMQAIRFLTGEQLKAISSEGLFYTAQLFKTQLTGMDKYILDQNRFFYRMLLQKVQEAIRQGGLQGDAPQVVEDILCLTRGVIYSWCLHEGSYKLAPYGARLLNILLRGYG